MRHLKHNTPLRSHPMKASPCMCPDMGSCRSPPSWTVLRWGRCGWRWWGWAPGTPGTRWTPGTPSPTPELRLNQVTRYHPSHLFLYSFDFPLFLSFVVIMSLKAGSLLQIPLNSVLFPLSTYVLATLKRIKLNISEVWHLRILHIYLQFIVQ